MIWDLFWRFDSKLSEIKPPLGIKRHNFFYKYIEHIYNEYRTAFCEGYFYLHLTQVKGRLNNPPTSLGGATFEEKRDSLFCVKYKVRTTDAQWNLFSMISQSFGPIGLIGRMNFRIPNWGIFGRTNSLHFGTVSPLSITSIIHFFFHKKLCFLDLFQILYW